MGKLLSVLSWNVEHFKDDNSRIDRIVDKIVENDPDVFGIYEVEGKTVYESLVTKMKGYSFHITEGPQTQEILLGVKSKFTAFFTQKLEFKTGIKFLRPGALLSIRINDSDYTFLFLHTKSGSDPIGLGIRDEMFKKACKLRKQLEKNVKDKWTSKYIFMGDLNTMGMKYPYGKNINPETEIQKLSDYEAKKVKMKLLKKDENYSWWNGNNSSYPKSELDHVVASDNIKFTKFGEAEVTVKGWPKEPDDNAKNIWIKKYSDHGIIYFEVIE
jgi:hypothetical protein